MVLWRQSTLSDETILEEIQAANERFRAGRAEPMDGTGAPFVVLACIDPRLTGFLEPALGLPRNRAIVIRTAGNRVGPANEDVIRSVAAAIYIKRAGEVFVTGHSDCAMARFSAAEVIDAFRNAGVPRSAFGEGDLREWFGAFPDIRKNVASAVEFLRRCPCIPRTVKVHGLVLDLGNAALEVIVNGDVAPLEAPSAAAPEEETPKVTGQDHVEPQQEKEPPVPPVPPPKAGPVVIPAQKAVLQPVGTAIPAPQTMMDAVIALREVFVSMERDPIARRQLEEFLSLVRRERNPVRIYGELEAVMKNAEGRYPQIPGILAFLRASLATRGTGSKFGELMRRIAE
jgi:carbonic anhydrase